MIIRRYAPASWLSREALLYLSLCLRSTLQNAKNDFLILNVLVIAVSIARSMIRAPIGVLYAEGDASWERH